MKKMALIRNDGTCRVVCSCPACDGLHHVLTDAADFLGEPIVGRYDGWDKAWELVCPRCEALIDNVFGKGHVSRLYKAGDVELVEELAVEISESYGVGG